MKNLLFLFLFFLLPLVLSTCSTYRYIYFDLKDAPKIDRIFLVSVNYHNLASETDKVFFPYSESMLEPFLDGLLNEFNSNDYDTKITTWKDLSQVDSKVNKLDNLILNNHHSILNYKDSLLIKDLPTWKKIKPYHKVVGFDYYLSLDLNLSATEQSVTGYFKLRGTNQNGRIIWREQLLHYSPYIENDPDSPYISKSQRIDYPPADSDSSHYLELTKMFRQLGEKVAKSLKDTLWDIKT